MKLDISKVNNKVSKKALEVLSKMEIGQEYSFKELNCHTQTLDSLLIHNCVKHVGSSLLPSHKIGKFKISQNLLDDIKYYEDVENGKIIPKPIEINMSKFNNIK